MRLIDLMEVANDVYDDEGTLSAYFNEDTGKFEDNNGGDSLARFIAIELNETFDKNATKDVQLNTAIYALCRAREQLQNVIHMLEQEGT